MPTPANKDYQHVEEILTSISSLASFNNKLVKVRSSTDDHELRRRIGKVVGHLENAWRASGKAGGAVSLRVDLEPYVSLISFCRECRLKNKPQWQLLAEKSGWCPPQNSPK